MGGEESSGRLAVRNCGTNLEEERQQQRLQHVLRHIPPEPQKQDGALSGAQGANTLCSQPVDIAFLLDDSSSISAVNFEKMITFVKDLVAHFDISLTSTRIAAITFSHRAFVEFTFGAYNTLAEVEHGFDEVCQRKGGETMTYIGLKYALQSLENFGRRDVPHILITITDGVSNNRAETAKMANMTRQEGIEIFVIGVGRKAYLVEKINPMERYRLDLLAFVSSIDAMKMKSQTCHHKPAEVVFVLDMSSSIFMLDFQKQLAFVSNLIKMFHIGRHKTRVAAVSFSTNATVEFHLDEFYDQKDVRDHVEMIRYTGGGTNTGDALKLVNDSVLISEHGVRSNVPHVVIVITDGRSQNSPDTRAQAKALKDSGIFMFAIGVGPYVDDQELKDIASAPSENFMFTIAGYDTLPSIKSTLALRVFLQLVAGWRSGTTGTFRLRSSELEHEPP
ncbi:collagen alpha-1(XII) chain-like [Aplysia californica]|uniref:Collagen alpha-1(XII) chain-like n=1 Tax=Aplysia californica TaxID=6500 RepID=A0ABM0JNR1_APLCA|nr:collagen alpha-1(XII) chain-like [Aplysia californica]